MSDFIQSVFALLVTFTILVTVHELGHYLVARFFGVHVLKFSLGFGTPIYKTSFAKKSSGNHTENSKPEFAPTEFILSAIPLGGYVKFLDDREQKVSSELSCLCYNHKTAWQRIAIAAAGPIANFLLAILCYWIVFLGGEHGISPVLGSMDSDSIASKSGLKANQEIIQIDSDETRTWRDVNIRLLNYLGETGEIVFTVKNRDTASLSLHHVPISNFLSNSDEPNPASALGLVLSKPIQAAKIGELSVDGRARAAGLRKGDVIKKVDKELIYNWKEFVSVIQANPEKSLSLQIERSGLPQNITLVPAQKDKNSPIGYIGASSERIEWPKERLVVDQYSFMGSLSKATQKTAEVIGFTLDSLKKMFLGRISTKNLSGPITIAGVASDTAANGISSFIFFIALLSISLGVINLLPIPMLDGGHILYYLIEVLRGKPLPERVQNLAAQVGIFMLLGIMTLAIYNDFMRVMG
ncbi:MAG: RIP metalloprotease RseP [Pseudomonadota bacterium]|nr:RIP metalloprotease RseP [Pseudomonadota bacterium]